MFRKTPEFFFSPVEIIQITIKAYMFNKQYKLNTRNISHKKPHNI